MQGKGRHSGLRARPRRPADPERSKRIAWAALEIVAEHGVEGVTHRRAAELAGVPLGSTTYYFRSLDHLLEVALALAVERGAAELKSWANAIEPGTNLVQIATNFLLWRADTVREGAVAANELWLAARRRPNLQPLAAAWSEQVVSLFSAFTDALTARTLAVLLEGCFVRCFVMGERIERADVEPLIARVVGPARV
jgi:TetR/AcrR family transcriptional regulator, regulator of biofilm formation and stress response